ncbi:MAG: hypothetical protein M5U19_06120 [Microthrixaceae bacterium]|nr:hypothetical protein [Microthrixaceae bacterium]
MRAKTGEPFEHRGQSMQVTPAPLTPGGPMVAWGGGSIAAARRAGRHGIGLFAQRRAPGMREAYEEAARSAGHEPGICFLPATSSLPRCSCATTPIARGTNSGRI